MNNDERDALREQLAGLEIAMASLETARQPFDEAISAVYGIKEALLERHETDVVGKCETCMEVVFEGDLAHIAEDVMFCLEHAPTWGDCSDSWEEATRRGDLDETEAKGMFAALETYIANGGNRDDKNVSPA